MPEGCKLVPGYRVRQPTCRLTAPPRPAFRPSSVSAQSGSGSRFSPKPDACASNSAVAIGGWVGGRGSCVLLWRKPALGDAECSVRASPRYQRSKVVRHSYQALDPAALSSSHGMPVLLAPLALPARLLRRGQHTSNGSATTEATWATFFPPAEVRQPFCRCQRALLSAATSSLVPTFTHSAFIRVLFTVRSGRPQLGASRGTRGETTCYAP